MFPDLQDDPGRAASETIALLRKAYDPDMNEDAAELYEPHKLPATRKILDILEGSDAEQDPARTLQRVLTASGEMPFDFTYDPRGLLIDQLKAGGRAEDFVEATVLRLKAQGITYAELQGKLSTPGVDPETFAEIGKRHGVVIRMLPHLLTHQFAEGGGGFDPAKLQALLFGKDADIHGNVPDMVGGLDICGPESGSWDKLGMERLGDVYAVLQRHALLSDRTLVLRPHVGEGYSGTEGQRRHGVEQDSKQGRVAQDNLDLILTQLSKMKKDKLYAQPPEGKVEIRLGHVTQATEAQVAKMKELGVIAEVNIGSNLVTGALGRSNEPGGSRLDQHPLLMLLYHDVHTLLSTDAGGVMSTDMAKEYGFAADILDRFRAGKTSITVPDPKNPKDGIVLKYADLPAEVQKRFHVEHLERTAKAYARLGSMRHNVEDGYMGDARAPRVLRKNASAKAKALGERYAQESDAEDAALSRNLDSAVIERMTPEERIEHLRSQLSALEALDATAGSLGPGMTGPSRAEVRRMVVELRTELLRDFERQLRTKHPGATIQSTSAGSDRLEIRVVDTPEPTEAAEALKQLGTKLLGEKWLAMLGIKLTTPADTNADKR
jgi:hypothetical protein